MEIALVGAGAKMLCRKYRLAARAFPSPADAAAQVWDLLALTRDAVASPFSVPLCARSLLLPGDSDPRFALAAHARQLVGYGFSPRDTLTLSCVTGSERLLCLQRGLLTAAGVLLEPQELPLPAELFSLPAEDALLVAGVRLLGGAWQKKYAPFDGAY